MVNAPWWLSQTGWTRILEDEGLSPLAGEDESSRAGLPAGSRAAERSRGGASLPGKRCSPAPCSAFMLQDILERALQNAVIFP